MAFRASLTGAVTGAALGGISRGSLAAFHFHGLNQDTIPGVLGVAVIGIVVGAVAGMTGRPLLGAVVGAALSALVYLGMLPIALFLQSLRVVSAASLPEVLGVGALTGALGGAAELLAGRRRSGAGRRDAA